ncbi:MAG: elongation factor G [Myxococcota bacterium]
MGKTYRNIAVIGPDGAGKTTLSTALMSANKKELKLASPDILDTDPEEKKRKFTLTLKVASAKWGGANINIIDTPGFSNFIHEADIALGVVESAVVVMDATSDAPHQTDEFGEMAERFKASLALFINKFDLPRAKFQETIERFEKETGRRTLPMSMPVGSGEDFSGIVNLFSMKMVALSDKGFASVKTDDIPSNLKDEVAEYRTKLVETIAEADEELMNKYLDDKPITEEELAKGLKIGFSKGDIVPVFVGSAEKGAGIAPFMDFLVNSAPAGEAARKIAVIGHDDKETEMEASPKAPFIARVFKTTIDHFVGRVSYARILSGKLTPATPLYNPNTRTQEKAASIANLVGLKQEPITEAEAGDIVLFSKLRETKTGETLVESGKDFILPPMPKRKSMIVLAAVPKEKADEEKISQAAAKLLEEDYGLSAERDKYSKELLLSGMGQSHLEVSVERLKRKSNVEIELKNPTVPYRETLRKKAQGQGRYKKQSGGRGQYGDVWIELSPKPRGSGFEFIDKIVGGAIPRNFLPAIEKGIIGAMESGPVGGFPVIDISATAYDGSYHDVDSSEMAFKVAGSLAFKKVSLMAEPVILEPIMRLSIRVPDEYMGDVIGDLNSRRGRVLGMEPLNRGWQQINATVPMAEMLRYAPELQSMTQGKGNFEFEFDRYEELPAQLKDKVVAEFGRKVQTEEE